jgi:hypothetical protein
MNLKKYQKIKLFVAHKLSYSLHSRHLEDCTQHVAMKAFENPLGTWNWFFIDYCRLNGLGNSSRLKHTAIAIERSCEINEEMIEAKEITEKIDIKKSINERVEEFLEELSLNNEVKKWAMKSFELTNPRIKLKLSKLTNEQT